MGTSAEDTLLQLSPEKAKSKQYDNATTIIFITIPDSKGTIVDEVRNSAGTSMGTSARTSMGTSVEDTLLKLCPEETEMEVT